MTTDDTPTCPCCGRALFLGAEQQNNLCAHCANDQLRFRQHLDRERRLLGRLADAGKVTLP